jgi:predicted aspartyl protease
VSIKINSDGPYDFVVDTGAQVTTIDIALASELQLTATGTAGVSGAGTYSRSPFTYLDLLEAGGQTVPHTLVIIQDIAQLKAADSRIRGILGEDFLTHFDLLLDNRQHVLCLDTSKSLALYAKGERTLLEKPYGSEQDLPFTRPLVVSVHIGSAEFAPVLLRLDSGSNAPLLYVSGAPRASPKREPVLSRVVNGAMQGFDVLRPQDIQIGSTVVRQVAFVSPQNEVGKGASPREDGMLPTLAFESVFVSYSEGYAVLKPWAP